MSPPLLSPGTLVSPRTPVQSSGLYWGYSVRLASSLSQVFTSCPFSSSAATSASAESDQPAEYDLVIGTAERGDSLTDLLYATQTGSPVPPSKPTAAAASSAQGNGSGDVNPLPAGGFTHALLLFGGLSGLEVAIERDEGIPLGLEDASELCDYWVDAVEGQGSRTVRTEVSEAEVSRKRQEDERDWSEGEGEADESTLLPFHGSS